MFIGFASVQSARPNLESDMDKITNLGFFYPHVLLLCSFLTVSRTQGFRLAKHQGAKEEENNFLSLIVASYLHWLQCG